MAPLDPPGPATELLLRAEHGDRQAEEELLQLVYSELRHVAGALMREQAAEHTLQPTALVHEAWLKLCDQDDAGWKSRGHFLAVAARAMRSVLVDHARARQTDKRGAGKRPLPLDEALAMAEERAGDVLELDTALSKLERRDPELARIVELRFFSGMTIEDVARHLGVSARTVDRGWRTARAWLRQEMERGA